MISDKYKGTKRIMNIKKADFRVNLMSYFVHSESLEISKNLPFFPFLNFKPHCQEEALTPKLINHKLTASLNPQLWKWLQWSLNSDVSAAVFMGGSKGLRRPPVP